jgi:hypothetical protein
MESFLKNERDTIVKIRVIIPKIKNKLLQKLFVTATDSSNVE